MKIASVMIGVGLTCIGIIGLYDLSSRFCLNEFWVNCIGGIIGISAGAIGLLIGEAKP